MSSFKPGIVPLQPTLNILQTTKQLATIARPIFWDTVVFDLSHWHMHEFVTGCITHHGIPLDKFQHIQLSLYNVPAPELRIFKSLKSLRTESRTRNLFELRMFLFRMEWYWRNYGQFELNILLHRGTQDHRLSFVVDQQGRIVIIETGTDSTDESDQFSTMVDLANSITSTSSHLKYDPDNES